MKGRLWITSEGLKAFYRSKKACDSDESDGVIISGSPLMDLGGRYGVELVDASGETVSWIPFVLVLSSQGVVWIENNPFDSGDEA